MPRVGRPNLPLSAPPDHAAWRAVTLARLCRVEGGYARPDLPLSGVARRYRCRAIAAYSRRMVGSSRTRPAGIACCRFSSSSVTYRTRKVIGH